MPKLLLEKSESITSIVSLYSMDGEGISEPVRADAAEPAGFWINQARQSCPTVTISYDLPSSMAINCEDQLLAITENGAALVDEASEHLQGIRVNRHGPDAPMLLCLSNYLFYGNPTIRAVRVPFPQPGFASRAGEFKTRFEMQDSNRAVFKAYVCHRNPEGLTDAAAQVEEGANE